MAPTILIAEGNETLRTDMEETFQKHGFETWAVENGLDALKATTSLKPDAIVIDLDLRKLGGLDLCRELRQSHHLWIPIILISRKIDEIDAVLGLELGADDYIVKPLRLKILVARVKSIIRRGNLCCYDTNENQGDRNGSSQKLLRNGDLTLDPTHFSVYKDNEEVIDFTRKEFELVYFLMKNKGKAFSRKHLLKVLSGNDSELDERIIDVFISRVRQKIEPHKRNPVYIKTVRNVGYMMKEMPVLTKGMQQSR
ncbi:DNA-binding response regulator [Salipaludibacillus keqinensis]|uniref:DNA-binding response regulator n=2 Tax=Salipaludibacillus keqinensis TaxID=2045207 RepID=A0A323TFE5_9BACI|nr:DNA-binding response regulator [Salipaludibacillus keqinensis]